ncbi:MAG: hemin uptake protein HemP [Verrucomicrobiae bacterium]|nr:hemin uptake protein HemP [Verrucomicrobiae bacterium]
MRGMGISINTGSLESSNDAKIAAAEDEGRTDFVEASAGLAPVVLDSERLFEKQNEIQIRHRGQFYRLRMTKNGKLILNK